MKRVIGLGLAVIFTTSSSVWAAPDSAQNRKFLKSFFSQDRQGQFTNVQKMMNQVPAKKSASSSQRKPKKLFTQKQIQTKQFIESKNQVREQDLKLNAPLDQGRSEIEADDMAEELVDSLRYQTLQEMESASLMQAELSESPWSDSYWPLAAGTLANRYADRKFTAMTGDLEKAWIKVSKFIYDDTRRLSSVDTLSPAEKYDLLVGDVGDIKKKLGWGLTRASLAQGEYYWSTSKKVEAWMGICHGWAPAAYMLDRPTNAITVKAADGRTNITFYPSDIKALGSLIWAEAAPGSRFIGGRCNEKEPEKAKENGRVIDQKCFDTNPGSWHLAVVNQIGASKRSFVLDATFDYEVWNQPIYSYSYEYFKPGTDRTSSKFSDAVIPISQFKNDPFAKGNPKNGGGSFRSPNAAYVVGVSMDVTYVVETEPSTARTDSSGDDSLTTATYRYDLELDRNYRIIGGEWYSNAHPDFLWTPEAGAKAASYGDYALRNSNVSWNGKTAVPADWSKAAKERSSPEHQPLGKIVESLITISRLGLR